MRKIWAFESQEIFGRIFLSPFDKILSLFSETCHKWTYEMKVKFLKFRVLMRIVLKKQMCPGLCGEHKSKRKVKLLHCAEIRAGLFYSRTGCLQLKKYSVTSEQAILVWTNSPQMMQRSAYRNSAYETNEPWSTLRISRHWRNAVKNLSVCNEVFWASPLGSRAYLKALEWLLRCAKLRIRSLLEEPGSWKYKSWWICVLYLQLIHHTRQLRLMFRRVKCTCGSVSFLSVNSLVLLPLNTLLRYYYHLVSYSKFSVLLSLKSSYNYREHFLR